MQHYMFYRRDIKVSLTIMGITNIQVCHNTQHVKLHTSISHVWRGWFHKVFCPAEAEFPDQAGSLDGLRYFLREHAASYHNCGDTGPMGEDMVL